MASSSSPDVFTLAAETTRCCCGRSREGGGTFSVSTWARGEGLEDKADGGLIAVWEGEPANSLDFLCMGEFTFPGDCGCPEGFAGDCMAACVRLERAAAEAGEGEPPLVWVGDLFSLSGEGDFGLLNIFLIPVDA